MRRSWNYGKTPARTGQKFFKNVWTKVFHQRSRENQQEINQRINNETQMEVEVSILVICTFNLDSLGLQK